MDTNTRNYYVTLMKGILMSVLHFQGSFFRDLLKKKWKTRK